MEIQMGGGFPQAVHDCAFAQLIDHRFDSTPVTINDAANKEHVPTFSSEEEIEE